MLRRGRGFIRSAGLAVLLSLCSTAAASSEVSPVKAQAEAGRQAHRWSSSAAGKSAYLYLFYADDSRSAPADGPCSGIRPPAFKCNYPATSGQAATTDTSECQRQVQTILDGWYADFDILFTFTRPTNVDYYTVVITSEKSWCTQDPIEAGVAPNNSCNDNRGPAAYALECGYSAHDCATIIAHEHGHLVGLEHTASPTDVMNQTVMPTATGFDDKSNRIVDEQCGLPPDQNSYQQMLTTLGAWSGAAKPSPFSSIPDAGAPDASPNHPLADASSTSSSVGNPAGGSVDGGIVVALAGFDALVRPPLPTAGTSGTNQQPSHGGCGMAGQPASAPGVIAALLLVALAAAFTRIRGRFPSGRRGRPAGEPLPCAAPARRPSASRSHGR
jgi:hypothetical protein